MVIAKTEIHKKTHFKTIQRLSQKFKQTTHCKDGFSVSSISCDPPGVIVSGIGVCQLLLILSGKSMAVAKTEIYKTHFKTIQRLFQNFKQTTHCKDGFSVSSISCGPPKLLH